ncbi:LysR family transcriptional regulator [uncultured Cohaesibacter sp.]|uniref:LysR family transcriptional regulator n=1 Tax=uncultured Cohaesibacter sp. TaxID=1002546 RepID=UPI002AAB48A2|nr:LysR family transcriptional regulator [uncultured Cohaesibacter sp.]
MDRTLEQFLEVADAGSFAAASSKLLISQPALTYNIKKLEEKMKVKLFKRSSRGVRLTTYGETLYKSAHLMRRIYANAIDNIDQLREEREHGISIGTGYSTWTQFFKDYLIKHHQAFPKVSINVSVGNMMACMDHLLAGDISLFVGHIIPDFNKRSEVEFIPLGMAADAYYVRPDHPLLEQPRHRDEITQWPTCIAVQPEDRQLGQRADANEPRSDWFGHTFMSNSMTACVDMVLETDMVLVHSTQLNSFLGSKGLVQIEMTPDEEIPRWLMGIYVLLERKSDPRIVEVIEAIQSFTPEFGFEPVE